MGKKLPKANLTSDYTVLFQFLYRQTNCSSISLQSMGRRIKFMTVPSAHRSSSFRQNFRYVFEMSKCKLTAIILFVCNNPLITARLLDHFFNQCITMVFPPSLQQQQTFLLSLSLSPRGCYQEKGISEPGWHKIRQDRYHDSL